MRFLADRANKTAPLQDLVRYFDNHRAQIANTGGQQVGYDDYLNFLRQSQMIEDAGNDTIRLTDWGEFFLDYLRTQSLNMYKDY